LVKIAKEVFDTSVGNTTPAPTPTPPWENKFYTELDNLRKLQTQLLKTAAQVTAAASSSKENAGESPFTRLADRKAFAASLKRIEVAYLDATKDINKEKLKLENASDKTQPQFKIESAYDLLIETTQLKKELDSLSDFTGDRDDLATLLSRLTTISATNSEVLKGAVASAINKIFSKPPEKKPASEGAKKDAKKDEDKKDNSTAKDGDKAKSKTQ
jgi:hypothetical protein